MRLAGFLVLACLAAQLAAGFAEEAPLVVVAAVQPGGAAAAAPLLKGNAANRTSNYTTCDPVCHKHVMWMEGLIILVVIVTALVTGCSCM